MPLSEDELPDNACLGVAADSFEDLEQVQDRIEDFLSEVLPRCRTCLKGLADGTIKKRNEKDLASSLCKWLGAFACEREVLFTFANEEPDKKRKGRTNDMALIPSVGVALLRVGSHYYDPDDHLYVIEAKLLPSPKGRVGQGDRIREYVVGNWAERALIHKKSSGGMERFKEGWHGQLFRRSAMIAFVISGTISALHASVNSWIDDLINSPLSSHKATWGPTDRLVQKDDKSADTGVAQFTSLNARSGATPAILLRHYWIICANGPK